MQVGKLIDENNIWVFEYIIGWLISQYCYLFFLYIILEVGKQIDGSLFCFVQWFFDNLLFEEKVWELLVRYVKVFVEDVFQLFKEVGVEFVGVIILMFEGEEVVLGIVYKLIYEEVNQCIFNLLQVLFNCVE